MGKASAGLGFAVPISKISKVANILIDKGAVARPNFGISFDMGLQAGFGSLVPNGVLISNVVDQNKQKKLVGTNMNFDGSVTLGDVILSINGIKVNSDLDAYGIVNYFKPGDEITLQILRMEKKKFVEKTAKVMFDQVFFLICLLFFCLIKCVCMYLFCVYMNIGFNCYIYLRWNGKLLYIDLKSSWVVCNNSS